MKIFISTIFLTLSNGEKFGSSEVSKDLKFGWDLQNNCGPRPQGPRYPQPPAASTGNPAENAFCDIMLDAQYISGYKCKAPCQADLEQTVEINCNCHTSMGPLQFIKQCEWEFVDGKRCPKLKTLQKEFDWECDPRIHNCPSPQYRSLKNTQEHARKISPSARPAPQLKMTGMANLHAAEKINPTKIAVAPIGEHGELITQKEKVNGTTSITNIIDFAPVFSKLFESRDEDKPEYNQPRRRSLRDHSDEEPDYDMDYYEDYSISSIFKQITKESVTVQRRLARTIAQRNHLRHVKTTLTKKLNSILDFVAQFEGSSEKYSDLAALITDLEGTKN